MINIFYTSETPLDIFEFPIQSWIISHAYVISVNHWNIKLESIDTIFIPMVHVF